MGRRCCIASCTSTSRLPEHHGVTYHSFPLDAATRAIWMRNTRIGERHITKSVLVCSRHFRRADFQPQRSGKYLLKQRVFPTVFPWGKIDPAQVASDLEELRLAGVNNTSIGEATKSGNVSESTPEEDATKATVEAKVAQIMAETAELNAAAGIKQTKAGEGDETGTPSHIKFEPVTNFSPGVRLEAQDFDGVWHAARIVEVDNDDREVLLRFERSGKTKSAVVGTEEWIPMNSTRLRQKVSTRPVPVFELEEKCMARWSGPRKFPGTVKKILGNDTYEVLFDDGFVKNVRAIHMGKFGVASPAVSISSPTIASPYGAGGSGITIASPILPPAVLPVAAAQSVQPADTMTSPVLTKQAAERDASLSSKKRATPGSRKDWPLLDLSKLDLSTLNLPEIPHDGEWTCHWVNDQPIGIEGFLIVGEHRKPTVIVEDWRLPPGWVKHMYQRSNVLGKWDVILVSPSGKRFRSKSDLKTFLEEQGQVYNPDIYDFSIHRRRAKDINAYVFTPDYTPQQIPKSRPLDALASVAATATPAKVLLPPTLSATSSSQYMETPVAMPVPPMELMTTSTTPTLESSSVIASPTKAAIASSSVKLEPGLDVSMTTSLNATVGAAQPELATAQLAEPGYAYIGGLKVQIIDNLFRCPEAGCSKNFRKENHLQIHVKHYHKQLSKLLGDCPKMQELAEKRTHTTTTETVELPQPKNQIPNQEFFAKLYQQDLQHSRSRGAKGGAGAPHNEPNQSQEIKLETEIKAENLDQSFGGASNSSALNTTLESNSTSTLTATESLPINAQNVYQQQAEQAKLMAAAAATAHVVPPAHNIMSNLLPAAQPAAGRRSRFVHANKRGSGARKSNRQRTTRRYLTAAQAAGTRGGHANAAAASAAAADGSFGVADFEETRHSFNATPDSKMLADPRKRKVLSAAAAAAMTPNTLSGLDSPLHAATDSGSSSFQTIVAAPGSNEAADPNAVLQSQYIKENGELIKIVRMRQEEIINCLCGFGEEDGLMIQCELCLCWQHGGCNGIDKESDVPDKYVCYICRNPTRGRESMRYKHDQDWLYEGTLPTANYHAKNPELMKRFEFLKNSHTLTGNLVELKRFMHSLRVKINVANNRCHPKLYLWAKKWEEDKKPNEDIKIEQTNVAAGVSPNKRIKLETPASPLVPNIPQPEAPIDPLECQQRLLEHIRVQQDRVMNRLASIEAEVDELERQDDLPDLKNADISVTKDVLSAFLKELDIMNDIAKINALENMKLAANAQPTH